MKDLDEYINQVKALPPAPLVLAQLLQLLRQEDVHSERVIELIMFDPALTAKVLQRCNSARFGRMQQVHDLNEAVARLGFNQIYSLLATVIGESVLGSPQNGYGIAAGELWQHSVTTALAARSIARKLGADENLAFTAALLHDVGKLVLNMFLEGSYDTVVRAMGSDKSFLETEKSVLGAEHAEIGGRLLQRWDFPETLVQAVWHHHDPARACAHQQVAAFVYMGDMIAHCLGQGHGHQAFAIRCRKEPMDILEITSEDVDGFLLQTAAEMTETGGLVKS